MCCAAAHGGVFRLLDDRLELVAGRAQDTMGFSVVGPHHFLASGHPAPTDVDRPVNLGLIESRDAGNTSTEKSLSGRADFHSIDVWPNVVHRHDSQTSTVLRTSDQQTWERLVLGEVYDLAARTRRAGRARLAHRQAAGRRHRLRDRAPQHRSTDGGQT